MKKIVNNIIPFEGFIAMTIWPFIFVRKGMAPKFDDVAENHENIHGEQQKEMLGVGILLGGIVSMITACAWWLLLFVPIFFWWYLIEYCLRSIFGTGNAYRKILFEQEAYSNERDFGYLKNRRPFAWLCPPSKKA